MMKEETDTNEWSETRLRVRYAETDQAGMVYHSNYLIWFEVGRTEHCRAHGFNYRDMETNEGAFSPSPKRICAIEVPRNMTMKL